MSDLDLGAVRDGANIVIRRPPDLVDVALVPGRDRRRALSRAFRQTPRHRRDFLRCHDESESLPEIGVPQDVAVVEPDPGVVSDKADPEPPPVAAEPGHHSRVSVRRVEQIEVRGVGFVIFSPPKSQ